jgi:hypothetical protein
MVALPKPSVPAPVGDGLCEEGRIQALEEYFKRQVRQGVVSHCASSGNLLPYQTQSPPPPSVWSAVD